ncbi:MAG: NADH-quinone oxidoreductase subunit L, partial [Clostridia bacterium]|nr:NADH-quinone oxidoreductase subunit L [Clostridia bacterium]
AARKAFVINTIGDVAILLAILVTVAAGAGTDIGGLLATASGGVTQGGAAAAVPWDTVAWLLLVGAAAKSAQLPLHTWLPDAMEGPTPVSALLHAATMVTAGVYLVVRFHAVFAAAPTAALAAAAVGMVTALLAATMAAVENDLKRVLAFSTMSQVGYMLGAAAVGALGAAVFHFFTHAFFKALLFLSAGIVIHAAAGEQDMRRLGGLSLARRLPLAYWTFLVGVLAITGAPGFAGFFSKDEILAAFWGTHPVLWGLGAVTAGLTAFYMFRALSLTFLAPPRTEIGTAGGGAGERAPAITAHGDAHLHERVPVSMAWPVMVLAAGAVAAGYVGLPGASLLARFLAPALGGENPPALSPPSLLAALALAAAGFAAAIALYRRGQPAVEARGGVWPSLHRLLAEGYYFDAFYRRVVLGSLQVTAAVCAEVLDPGLIGGVVAGVGWLTALTGRALGFLQSGYTRRYALTVAASAALVLAYFVLASGSGRGPRP